MYRNRIREYRTVASADLLRNPLNFRRHPEAQRTALRGLLTSVGRVAPILAYTDASGALVCLDGHARLDESDTWDVAILDIDEREAATVLAMLDKIGAQAEIDPDALIALLDSLPTEARQTAGAAWSDDELAALIGAPEIAPGAGGDEFDPTPDDGTTRTALGELWIIGGKHRLLIGDCTDPANVARLMGGERADIGFSDPPYNVEYVGKTDDAMTIENDDSADVAVAGVREMANVLAAGAPIYVCFPAEQPAALAAMWDAPLCLQSMIVWAKNTMVMGRKDYQYQHEPVWYGWKTGAAHRWYGGYDKVTLWHIDRPQQSEDHPTEKPIALPLAALENSSKRGDLVIDFFAGSGVTLTAAHRTSRRAYLCEIAPRYADVILRRAEAEGLEVERATA